MGRYKRMQIWYMGKLIHIMLGLVTVNPSHGTAAFMWSREHACLNEPMMMSTGASTVLQTHS
jgi:hypothetical protein